MAHTYTNLLTHALFSTKDRQPIIRAEMKPDLFAYLGGIIKQLRGKPILINGPQDHVHLLFVLPANLALADFMEKLKANSSQRAKEWARGFAWQTGTPRLASARRNWWRLRNTLNTKKRIAADGRIRKRWWRRSSGMESNLICATSFDGGVCRPGRAGKSSGNVARIPRLSPWATFLRRCRGLGGLSKP